MTSKAARKSGGGTQAELTTAYRKGFRRYMVSEVSTEEISRWVLATTDRGYPNFDERKTFLAVTYGKGARQQALWK